MDKYFAMIMMVIIFTSGASIVGYRYIDNKDNKVMADSGLEQCPAVPTWMNSGTIWVKDCEKYMKAYISVQEKD